jgi:hypothetical protein
MQSAQALIEPSSTIDDDEVADPEKLWRILDYGWLSDSSRSDSPFQPNTFSGVQSSNWVFFEDLIGDDILFSGGNDFQAGLANFRPDRPSAIHASKLASARGLGFNETGAGIASGQIFNFSSRT